MMTDVNKLRSYEIVYVIVNYGVGSKVLHKAKEYGVSSGTVFLGKGTISNSLLNFLSLYDERKEIVLLGTYSDIADKALDKLNETFQFEKPNHGIVFSTGAVEVVGSMSYKSIVSEEEERVNQSMYQVIISVVNKGKAEDVIEAAKHAGSKGGTIMNARGSGLHDTAKLFSMEIEPEKEIVMILSKGEVTDAIVSSIREELKIDKPGNGIIFVQNVNRVYGIYE